MEQNRLDRHIKKQVENYKSPVDTDAMWKAIQAKQTDGNKSKRRFIWFWVIGFCLLLGLGTTYYSFNNTTSKQKQVAQFTPVNEKQKNKVESENKIEQENVKANDRKEIGKHETTINNKNESLAIENKPKTNHNNKKLSRRISKKSTTKKSVVKKQTNLISEVNKDDINLTASIKDLVDIDPVVSQTMFFKDGKDNQVKNIISLVNEENLNGKQINNVTKTEATKNANSFIRLNKFNATVKNIEPIKPSSITASIETPNYSLKEKNAVLELFPRKNYSKTWVTSLNSYISYGVAPSLLSSDTIETYMQQRNDSEKTLDAIRAGIGIKFQHANNWYFKSGLEYEQINEQFNFYEEIESDSTLNNVIVSSYILADGTQIDSLGTINAKVINWTNHNIYNRYKFIDVPVLFGYSKKFNRNLNWFIEGGLSVNLIFKQNGAFQSQENILIRMEDEPDLYKKNVGISLLAASGVKYSFNNNLSVWLAPNIKYKLGSITSDINPIEQRFLNIGLQTGVSFNLN